MPHTINIDSIRENIFLLLNMAYASGVFAQKHDIVSSDSEEIIDRDYYFGWLRAILSEKLIESASKTRVLIDIVLKEEEYYKQDGETYPTDVIKMDKEICSRFQIGRFEKGTSPLSLREACNKIIHATDWQPDIVNNVDDTPRGMPIWTGHLLLFGQKGEDEWTYILNVVNFCLAMEELLSYLENEVDWHHMYKYDDIF